MSLAMEGRGRKPFARGPQQSPLPIAEKATAEVLSRHKGVVSVYLAGSVARGEATASSDIDLTVVVESGFEADSRQPPLTVTGRTVFYRLRPKRIFADVEGLLTNSLVLSSQLVDTVILYDPTGFVSRVRAKALRLYHEPRFVKLRIGLGLRFAEDYLSMGWEELRKGNIDMVPPHIHSAILYGLGPAIFFIAAKAPTDRRCLRRLREVCEGLDKPGLYQTLTELINLDGASHNWALKAMEAAKALHRLSQTLLLNHDSVIYEKNKDWLSDPMRHYMIDGAEELLAEGDSQASVFCSMELGTRCLEMLSGVRLKIPRSEFLKIQDLHRQLFNLTGFDRDKAFESLTRAQELIEEVGALSKRLR